MSAASKKTCGFPAWKIICDRISGFSFHHRFVVHLVWSKLGGVCGFVSSRPALGRARRWRRPRKTILVLCETALSMAGRADSFSLWPPLGIFSVLFLRQGRRSSRSNWRFFSGHLWPWHFRHLQSDSLQNAVAGAEFLADDCAAGRHGRGMDLVCDRQIFLARRHCGRLDRAGIFDGA